MQHESFKPEGDFDLSNNGFEEEIVAEGPRQKRPGEEEEDLFPEDDANYVEPRVIAVNRPDLNAAFKYKDNYVSTTKYTVRTLLVQFRAL